MTSFSLSLLRRTWVRLILGITGVAVFWFWLPLPVSAPPTTRDIEINAAQYAFTPGRIRVNRGDRVIITLTSTDVVHGLYLDGYGVKTRVVPGKSEQIEFTADKTGKFKFRCLVSCGSLHPFMVGELVVGPNHLFWKVVGGLLTALAGLMVYLWQSGMKKEYAI